MAAIAQGKDVLPLLIDETPLPRELTEFHYIDFRGVFGSGHDADGPQPASDLRLREPPKERTRRLAGIAFAAAWLAAGASWFMVLRWSAPSQPSDQSPMWPWLVAVLGFLLIFVLLLLVRRRWHRKSAQAAPVPCGSPPLGSPTTKASDILLYQRTGFDVSRERQVIADAIEWELIRRTGAPPPDTRSK